MRGPALLLMLLFGIAVADAGEIRSADLVGEWVGGTSAIPRRLTFRADHSYDSLGGDAYSAGRWELHGGNQLELIIHYDYDPKPISSSSPRGWITIESISKGRMRLRWHSNLNGHPLPSEEWTKRR